MSAAGATGGKGDQVLKIILLGDSAVGKSKLVGTRSADARARRAAVANGVAVLISMRHPLSESWAGDSEEPREPSHNRSSCATMAERFLMDGYEPRQDSTYALTLMELKLAPEHPTNPHGH